jgi:hypothetical protein
MFEPWIRMFDSAAGAGLGAYTDGVDTAASMMQQGAREGEQVGGMMGSVVGGTIGMMYGSIMGFVGGTFHGGLVGAKQKMESKKAATSHDPQTYGGPATPIV